MKYIGARQLVAAILYIPHNLINLRTLDQLKSDGQWTKDTVERIKRDRRSSSQ